MNTFFIIYEFETDEILNELTPIMKKHAPKRIPVPDVLYEYFIMRSRANLHVVLCFSPVKKFWIHTIWGSLFIHIISFYVETCRWVRNSEVGL